MATEAWRRPSASAAHLLRFFLFQPIGLDARMVEHLALILQLPLQVIRALELQLPLVVGGVDLRQKWQDCAAGG